MKVIIERDLFSALSARELKSSPKVLNDQRFPCPALLLLVFMGGSRAAAPIGDGVL